MMRFPAGALIASVAWRWRPADASASHSRVRPTAPQSEDGERFIERALSASVTWRLQTRSMFAYTREQVGADARRNPL